MAEQDEIPELAAVVERNVNALLHRKQEDKRKLTMKDKLVTGITNFAGSMGSVYFHLFLFGGWIAWNQGWLHLPIFDPNYIFLATFAAVEAIFLTTFVLIGQRHLNLEADKWAELDLQVSLLTEHEVTQLMKLVKAIASKMNIEEADDKEIEQLSQDTRPETVLDTIENAGK
ncbi:MAG: DUF1003 domain-containing protein [Chitinophagaceae bacterium]|nr:DUF1003 domain-containing protein [Chitinophagaceae bacterium]